MGVADLRDSYQTEDLGRWVIPRDHPELLGGAFRAAQALKRWWPHATADAVATPRGCPALPRTPTRHKRRRRRVPPSTAWAQHVRSRPPPWWVPRVVRHVHNRCFSDRLTSVRLRVSVCVMFFLYSGLD